MLLKRVMWSPMRRSISAVSLTKFFMLTSVSNPSTLVKTKRSSLAW
jgi:hypothetical protein